MTSIQLEPERAPSGADAPASSGTVQRFALAERLLHWNTAFSVMFLLATGALIWKKLDEWEIGGINVISQAHVWLGGLLLVGGAIAFALLRRQRIPHAERRFSVRQQLGLKAVRISLLLMTLSGSALYLRSFLAMSKPLKGLIKDVHFWIAVPVLAFVLVHLVMVLLVPKNRCLLRGMLTGRVDRAVAERVSPDWLASVEAPAKEEAPVT